MSIILNENLKKLYIHLAFNVDVIARHRVTKRIKDKRVKEEERENDRLINLNKFRRKQQQYMKKNSQKMQTLKERNAMLIYRNSFRMYAEFSRYM